MNPPKHPSYRMTRKPHSSRLSHLPEKRQPRALRPLNELASVTAIASLSRKFFNVALF